jgi:hypothetical protein
MDWISACFRLLKLGEKPRRILANDITGFEGGDAAKKPLRRNDLLAMHKQLLKQNCTKADAVATALSAG